MPYTKEAVVKKLMNDSATKNDWEKSRKSFSDDDFAEWCEGVYENTSNSDIDTFMDEV